MACHAQCHPRVCAAQEPWVHATLDVVQPYVQSKGDDGMLRTMLSDRGDNGMLRTM